ncbi:MAG: hypothetical protein JSR39_03210 [Verrucomicrobia bacterium]|nr:hypothetical protein [Verrucomicrobiota bacterium]
MKKLYLLGLAIAFAAFSKISAEPIRSYQELTEAVRSGDRFVILLDLPQCTGNANMPMGYFAPNSMMLMPATATAPERVVTSLLHFSDHTGKPAYEYVKFTIHSDGSAIVRTTFYDPQTFTPIGPGHIVQCSIGHGIEIHQ